MVTLDGRSVLIAGESWFTHELHVKGFSDFTRGTYAEGHQPLTDALSEAGAAVTYLPNHEATERFPWDADALEDYDVVVLSDLPADTLLLHPDTFTGGKRTPNRLAAIADFVRRGGGFLMVGGYLSFSGIGGRAAYHFTPIADILPVGLHGIDDRIETPEGCTPTAVGSHPVIDELPTDWPWFLGYNRLRPIEEGDVLARVGDDPFLAVRDVGAGRTAAFASDCSPHWGSPDFLAWEGYAPLWTGLVRWLAGE
jgi:uncharacterized membrane protein